MKHLLFISLLFLSGVGGFAQIAFQKTFGGSQEDWGAMVRQTSDSGYVIVGFTKNFGVGDYDVYLIKTDGNGDTLWTKTYGGSLNDRGYSVEQTTDGGYIVGGYTESFGAGLADLYLIKTDANGNMLWAKTYGGADVDDGYSSVHQTFDGGYIITGNTYSFGVGWKNIYAIKTDGGGNVQWSKTYGRTATLQCTGYSCVQTADSGFVITGTLVTFGPGGQDLYLIKADAAGDTLWTKTFGGPDSDAGYSVQQTSDGGYIVVGMTSNLGPNSQNFYLIRTDSGGDTLWTKAYGGPGTGDLAFSVNITSDEGFIIAGRTSNFGPSINNGYLMRTDSIGDTLWTKTFGGNSHDYLWSAQQTFDGGFIVAGETQSFGAGNWDVYLLKTDADGRGLCNQTGTAAMETPTVTWLGSGAIIGSGAVANNPATIVSNTATMDSTLCSNVGIQQLSISNNQYIIYPNPTTGKFTVSSRQGAIKKVEVYDLFGRLVLCTNKAQIDMSSYPAGIYFVRVGEERGKLILE